MKTFLKIFVGLMLAATVGIAGWAVASGGSDEAINLNIIWAYILAGASIVSALLCVATGMLKSGGIVKSILSFVVVAAIVGAAYYYASGNELKIINLENGGLFEATETIITETSVIVAYVAGAGAIVAAIFSEVFAVFK